MDSFRMSIVETYTVDNLPEINSSMIGGYNNYYKLKYYKYKHKYLTYKNKYN